jgi:hypothetical protein
MSPIRKKQYYLIEAKENGKGKVRLINAKAKG